MRRASTGLASPKDTLQKHVDDKRDADDWGGFDQKFNLPEPTSGLQQTFPGVDALNGRHAVLLLWG